MKKFLTTCALVTLGGIAAFAGNAKKQVTGLAVKHKKINGLYLISLADGDVFKAYAWGKNAEKIDNLSKKEKSATFTVSKNEYGHYVVRQIQDN